MARRNGKGHSAESASPNGDFAALNGAFGDAVQQGRSAFESALKAFQEETLHFMNRRLERNSHALEQSQNCKNAMELLSAQQKWMAELSKDYYDEAARFGNVWQKWMHDTNGLAARGASAVREAAE